MDGIVPEMSRADKRRLEKRCRKLKDGDQKTRYLIILNLAEGRSVADTAKALKVSRSTVYRVAARFREEGEDGLIDHREENGETKLDDEFLSTLWEVVESCPLDHGWKRPTWTREMLVRNDGEEDRRQHPCLYDECRFGEDWRPAGPSEANCRINVVETSEKQAIAGTSGVGGGPS